MTLASREVKVLLLRRGLTITDLAARAGYRREYVSTVLHNHRRSRRAQERIAQVLGKRLDDLAVRPAA